MKTKIVCTISALALASTLVTVLIGLLVIGVGASSSDLPMLQPAPNTHDAPITTSIVITFTTAIDPSTVSRAPSQCTVHSMAWWRAHMLWIMHGCR